MKTFTKICLLAMVMLLPTFIIAQESLLNFTGKAAPDKQEFIQQLHGPDVVVPPATDGGGKAVGDDCSNPETITVEDVNIDLPYESVSQTTVGRGNNYDNTCLNDFDGGEDMIYELVLDVDATLTFNLDPKGTPYSGFALNEQCYDNPTATCLAVSTDTYGTGEAHGFAIALEAGTYYIIVDSWPTAKTTSIPDFDLTIDVTDPVPNDECANATEINEVSNYFFNTEEATTSGGNTDANNIWFKYTSTITGNVVVSLCGSLFDTQLVIWDGCSGSVVASNDDACGYEGLQSTLTLSSVTAGDEFWIEIGGFEGASGIGYLDIYEDMSGCDLTCPPGGTPEGETCGDDINGGCNMDTPAFTTVSDGDTVCGNLWTDDGFRDTDWFEITIDAISNIKLAVTGEESAVYGMIAQVESGVAGCDNMYGYFAGYKTLAPCIEDSIEFGYLQPGTYYFMVAPTEFFNNPCPGFDYQAAFTVQPSVHGTISGVVDDGSTGIGGIEISAGGYTAVTAGDGSYSLDIPSGTYDVMADGISQGYSTGMSANRIVTEGGTTTVDFSLNQNAPLLTATVNNDFTTANLNWTSISLPKDGKGTDVIMGSVDVHDQYTPGSTMDLHFTLTVYTPFPDDPYYGEYFEISLPAGFTINSASDFEDTFGDPISADISGQTVSWEDTDENFWQSGAYHIIDFSIDVTIDGGTSGPQVADYYCEGDGWTGYPWYFDGLVTIFEDGGPYVPTFNVYRRLDDGTGNVFIPLVTEIPDYELFDVITAGNWCYYVTQNMPDGSESAPSDVICVNVLDPCDDAIDYGSPGDAAQTATLDYPEQVVWFKFTTPGGDIQISTCGSDFNTQFARYESCEDIPFDPRDIPDGAIEVATDGCDDIGQANAAYCTMDAGTYYLAVYGENGETGDIEVEITKDFQCLTIMDGWSGFSTYIEPSPSDQIEDVLAEMADEMIITIRQTPYGIWWVPENINTIGAITPVLGYKAKMDGQETTIVTGTEIANKTVNIPQGASYLPVRVPYPTDINDLATQLGTDLLIIYNINNAAELYWPDGGLNTLPQLLPDYAYQINVYNEVDFTYPSAKSSQPQLKPYTPAPFKGQNVAWNDVVNTGNPHFISIQKAATGEIQIGDLIGVFNSEGLCVGFTEVENLDANLLLTAYGDDQYTVNVTDGLEEGEMMNFKLYRPSIDEEYAVEVTWNAAMPNSDGLFATNGMSMITSFKVGSTDITESEFANVSIFPNPSTGQFNIKGLQADATATVTNAQGQVIYTGNVSDNGLLDLSSQPKGVYFIRLVNSDEMMIQKVILK